MAPLFHLYALSDEPYAITGSCLAAKIFLSSLPTEFLSKLPN
jgi:hypothetical protein